MSRASTFFLLLLGGILVALVIAAPFFEVADNALISAGTSFDGDPPPCRADRVGVVLTLKGRPSVCAQTGNGYEWTPTNAPAQPVRVAPPAVPAGIPRTAQPYQPCSKAQHGWRTGDGLMICVENGRNPGQFYWFPY